MNRDEFNNNEFNENNEQVNEEIYESPANETEVRPNTSKKTKKKKKGTFKKIIASVLCGALFGVTAVGSVCFLGDRFGVFSKLSSSNSNVQLTTTETVKANTEEGVTTADKKSSDDSSTTSSDSSVVVTDVSDIVENVMPSIVAITSSQKVQAGFGNDFYDYYFGYGNNGDSTYEETGAGSGIIIGKNDTELLIVTNNHVIEDADSLVVQFVDEKSVDAKVKGTDSDLDLAVVAVALDDIDESTLAEIKVATLGDSDALEVGEGTIAIGNALGYGQSVTTGVISALDREVEYENTTKTLIQTDAAINPGNSGGALLNMNGEVIGINAAKYSSSSVEGMGFAIPISSVKEVIEDLMNQETKEKVDEDERGSLNIYVRDITSDLSEYYGFPEGVYVVQVMENGAAEKAGVKEKDIITKINGQSVTSLEELSAQLEYYAVGDKVELTIQRASGNDFEETTVEVTLGESME